MKDLKELWDSKSADSNEWPEIKLSDIIHLKEKTDKPINKLKRNLKINSAFGFIFLVLFAYLLITVSGFWFKLFMSSVCLAYVAAIIYNFYIERKYLSNSPADSSIAEYLFNIHSGMKKAFHAVEYAAVLIYPLAMTAGFLLPLTLENKLHHFSEGPKLWITLLVLYVVLTPILFYVNRYLTNKGFGKYIDEIKTHLDELNNNFTED